MNPQQLRKENEQEYKVIKSQFKRQKEIEQIFIIEIAVPWYCKRQLIGGKSYNELTKQLAKKKS